MRDSQASELVNLPAPALKRSLRYNVRCSGNLLYNKAMSTDADMPELRISAYMNLEQAMAEVRAYLEAKRRYVPVPHPHSLAAGQLSMQGEFVARLSDIATRLGQVEPNSKLGPPGVFLKRVVAKLIGWYSRPVHQFDRTAIENFQQIRQDMLQLQQQIAILNERIGDTSSVVPQAASERSAISAGLGGEQSDLLCSMFAVFKSLMAVRAVRQVLQDENPGLLQRVEGLLDTVEGEFRSESRVPGANARTDQ